MKVTAISDLHGNLIDIEPCDLLLICGDVSPLEIQKDYIQMTKWIFNDFYDWIMNLPCDKVVMTSGNHDFWFEKFLKDYSKIDIFNNKLTILINSEYNYYSHTEDKYIKIYGTPYCKRCGNWAYMEDTQKLYSIYNNIPKDLDILITHDAPNFAGVGITHEDNANVNFSNYALTDEIKRKRPKIAICGHIHSGNHKLTKVYDIEEYNVLNPTFEIKVANCSILDESYSIYYKPLTFEL